MHVSQETAELLGLQVLTWLIGHDDLLPVFMGSTGATEDDMRQGVTDPGMQAAVLDFVLMDDAWVMQAGDALGVSYETLAQVRAMLPGGEQVHWT